MGVIRVLFLSDTHLGFDLPQHPRVEKRRRGPEFFANFERALEPALQGQVDFVVHGGDLLYRSKVPLSLVDRALQPLKEVADRGVPVFLVPGNHERSKIPYGLLAMHPNLMIFDTPRTFVILRKGVRIAVAGFPYIREEVRARFTALLQETGWRKTEAEASFLCIHQLVEGARVGPSGYQFRNHSDVIRPEEVPSGFQFVLCGHVHRSQVLSSDLMGKPLPVPVLYAGSTERTSFAERDETKGFCILEVTLEGPENGKGITWEFCPLPSRPMHRLEIWPGERGQMETLELVRRKLAAISSESIVDLRVQGTISSEAASALKADSLRKIVPESMNLTVRFPAQR